MVIVLILAGTLIPLAYTESWLDPFTTLQVRNDILHPHAIYQVGFRDPSDRFQSKVFKNAVTVQELMHELSYAVLDPSIHSENIKQGEKIFFTLHCQETKFHAARDYPLVYYPESNVIYFGNQFFQINSATTLLLNTIIQKAEPGWW